MYDLSDQSSTVFLPTIVILQKNTKLLAIGHFLKESGVVLNLLYLTESWIDCYLASAEPAKDSFSSFFYLVLSFPFRDVLGMVDTACTIIVITISVACVMAL